MDTKLLTFGRRNSFQAFALAFVAMLLVFTNALAAGGNPIPSFAPTTQSYTSSSAYDGWILESGENSSAGGILDRKTNTLFVGDDSKNQQYVSILSFNTWALPPYAVVQSAQLRLKKQGFAGNPLTTLSNLTLDIRNSAFSQQITLQLEDFSAPASLDGGATLAPIGDEWYAVDLPAEYLPYISTYGVTQFRLRFSLDDNDNFVADYLRFFSGNADANQPQLIITYNVVPPPAPTTLSPVGAVCAGTVDFAWTQDSVSTTQYLFEYSANAAFATSLGSSGWINETSYSVTINPGAYYWHIKARNPIGESDWSAAATLTVNSCLLPPTLISPSNNATVYLEPAPAVMALAAVVPGPVDFTWNPVVYATEYYFEYSDDSSFATVLGNSGWISATNHTVNLALGAYYWRVKARDATSESAWSEIWMLTVSDAPAVVPTFDGLSFSSGNDGWILESGENSSEGGTLDRNSNTLVVGDDAGNRQYVSILSFNTWKLPPNATITAAQLRLRKQSFTGDPFTTLGDLLVDIKDSAFGQRILLQLDDFSAPASLSGGTILQPIGDEWYAADLPAEYFPYISKYGVTQFRIRYALDDNDNFAADYVRFYSANADANQPQLIIQYDILPPPTPPEPTSSAAPICAGTTANFSWTPNASSTTEYYFEYSSDPAFTTVLGNSGWITSTSYSMSLGSGTYTWHVKARNASGESVWGTSATLTVGDCPVAPVLISPPDTGVVFMGLTDFTWNPSTYATEYYFEYSNDASFATTLGNSGWISATSYSVNLTGGVYYWRVKARNAISESGWSAVWSVTDPPPPSLSPAVTTLGIMEFSMPATPTSRLENNSVVFAGQTNFTWSSVPENVPVSGATEYYFEYNGASSGSSGWISATNYSANLSAGAYSWHVKARNSIDESDWSETWNLVVVDPPTLASPSDLATLLAGPTNFAWNAVNGATEYYFEYNGASSGASGWVSGTNYSASLKAGVYTWHVKARNALSESDWSATWTVNVMDTRDKGVFSWYNYDPFMEYSGSVDPLWREQWNFILTTQRGFQIEAATTSGNLIGKLSLYDASWNLLGEVNGSGAITTLSATQPTGSYYLLVEQTGGTSGNYRLRLTCTTDCSMP